MPQASEEQRAEWGDHGGCGEHKAISFLQAAGYVLRKDWLWIKPSPDHTPTPQEIGAVRFLIDEWDFGGIINDA